MHMKPSKARVDAYTSRLPEPANLNAPTASGLMKLKLKEYYNRRLASTSSLRLRISLARSQSMRAEQDVERDVGGVIAVDPGGGGLQAPFGDLDSLSCS